MVEYHPDKVKTKVRFFLGLLEIMQHILVARAQTRKNMNLTQRLMISEISVLVVQWYKSTVDFDSTDGGSIPSENF